MIRPRQNKILSVLLICCYLFSYVLPTQMAKSVQASEVTETYSFHDLSALAIEYIKGEYVAGANVDAYTAYVLTQAGENLNSGEWSRNGVSLADRLTKDADLLGENRNLVSYIVGTQNANGSFGPYANAYGSRIALQALGMVQSEISGDNTVDQAVYAGIDYFKGLGFATGEVTYQAHNGVLDYRVIEALSVVGEDLTVGAWVYDDKSLQQQVIESAQAAIANAGALGPEVLAKELAGVYAVDADAPEVATLAAAIKNKATVSPSGGTFFGQSIYDDLVVLTALGKTGQLAGVDQSEALTYLKGFALEQKDIFGSPRGKAWWGWDQASVETDLTAQVLTSLSFFDGAQTADSEVASLINDGLAYLQYQQNADTAAIQHAWDATSATAESLISLKVLGQNYLADPWVRDSRTKTLAQFVMGLAGIGDTTRANRLANLLVQRQIPTGQPGAGSFENSVFSDMWAYIALGKTNNLGSLDVEQALQYILAKQASLEVGNDNLGSWGETFDIYYPDFLSSVQAIEALVSLTSVPRSAEIQTAIDNGLAYVKRFQQENGGVYHTWDDPVVDNAEIIIMLNAMNTTADSTDWTREFAGKRVNPASFLAAESYNSNQTFGSSENMYSAAQVLYASTLLATQDIANTVMRGVEYLNTQYNTNNGNYLYKEYLGYRATVALSAVGADLTSSVWSKDGKALAARVIEEAQAKTSANDVVDIGKTLILLSGLTGENLSPERARLVSLIAEKQQPAGNFADGVIYNEVLAYLAITMVDGWDQLSLEARNKAKDWLIATQTQTDPNLGSWQHAWGTDIMSTAQAIYVLAQFEDSQVDNSATKLAIDAGLNWLKSKQGAQGQISDAWDVAVVDTAETALAVIAAGGNPDSPEWSRNGQSLIDYLLLPENIKTDGSIIEASAEVGNVGSTSTVLHALLDFNEAYGWLDFAEVAVHDSIEDTPSNPGAPSESNDSIAVDVAVVDKEGKKLYGPRSNVNIGKDDEYGLTALSALVATGLNYELGYSGSKVESIEGVANSGLNGWMFKVNDQVPATAAIDFEVEDGDQIIWWYSTDYNSDGPTWAELQDPNYSPKDTEAGSKIQLTELVQQELSKLAADLGEDTPIQKAGKTVAVINGERKPFSERKLIKAELIQNEVKLSLKVKKSEDSTVADSLGELSLQIPANALSVDKTISFIEKTLPLNDTDKIPGGWRSIAPIYSIEPTDIDFKEDAILQVKVPIPALIKPENVVLARFDSRSNQWLCVPAIVDANKNLIMAKIDALGEFTVFGKEEAKAFSDVQPELYQWANTSIATLAGAGIITGVTSDKFEPKRSVTRAELVSLLVRALALPTGDAPVFKDVKANDWFKEEVAAAQKAGLVSGYEDGSFRPQQLITREEMAVIMAKALELKQDSATPNFRDEAAISAWAKRGVATIAAKGLINGFPDGKFQPKQVASRAQCAVVIHKLLGLE